MNADNIIRVLMRDQARAQRASLIAASLAAGAATMAAAILLGLSGWFLTGAALAGLAGAAAAHSFNYMIPSALVRLLAILRTGLRYCERLSGHRAALNALAAIRPDLFRRMAARAPGPLLSRASGEVAARLVQDVDTLQGAFVRRSASWGAAGGMVAGVGLAALAGPAQGMIVAVAIGLSLLASRSLSRRLARSFGQDLQRSLGMLKTQVAAIDQVAPEIRAYGLSGWAVEMVQRRSLDVDLAQAGLARAAGVMQAVQGAILTFAVAGLTAASLNTDPALAALGILAVMAGVEGAAAFAEAERQAGSMHAAISRLESLARVDEQVAASRRISPDLHLRGLENPLSAPDRLAIVGPSGSGKTSLVERLMGLRTPQAGEWMAGGLDICGLDRSDLRCLFAYAPQDARFVAGTVRQNLQLASPPASDADLWKALEDAALADRFRSGDGLDTMLLDDAHILSGGERRRLTLARAYLKPAAWLVLDEPTEQLDGPLAQVVLSNLDHRLARTGQGLIMIGHRATALWVAERCVDLGTCMDGDAEGIHVGAQSA